MNHHSHRNTTSPLPLRLGALTLAACQLWSLGLAGAARAVTYRPPVDPGHARALSPDEMRHILGAQGAGNQSGATAVEPAGGGSYPWQGGGVKSGMGAVGASGSTNTANGNKTTALTLVGWTARGGLPVSFTLTHNSQSARNADLGHKWACSYDISLTQGDSGPIVHWGDDLAQNYAGSGGTFTPPTGIHDALVQNVDGTDTLTKTDRTAYHFTADGYCDGISDANGNTLTINRNASHNVTGVVDANGRAVTLGYDASNRIHTVTDPLGRVWTLTYSAANDLIQITWPTLGGTTYSMSYGYNGAHDITSVTDLRGNSRSLTYNGDDSLATEGDNAGNTTAYAYTSSGTTVTDANGHATVYAYTGGLLMAVTDPAGQSEHYAYDAGYNKTHVQDKRGHSWNYTYNGGGDQLTATVPLGHTTTVTYNAHHKPLTLTLPGGAGVVYTYDTSDNLTQTQEKDASGVTLATTTYTVGAYGLIAAKTDANSHVTHYGYDTCGNLASVTTPLGNETQWGHDALGVKTSRTDAMGRETDYTLDAWERVTAVAHPDTSYHLFTYDANGNLTQFSDATGTTSRAFDADNRILSESKDGAPVVGHTYDAAGRKGLLSTTTDADGRVIAYAYTGRDQLSTVAETAGTTTYGYDNAGLQTGITNANGTTVANVYDDAGRLTSVTNKNSGGTTLSGFSYGYNSDNLRTSCTESGGDTVTYGYDGQLHLTSESRTGDDAYTNTYAVDGVGNRTEQTVGGVTRTLSYDEDDELTDSDGVSYGYDADGQQTSRACFGPSRSVHHVGLTYDYDGNLLAANGTSFEYDALGRQTSRTAGGVTTAYRYDGGMVLTEKQGAVTTAAYTYGNALIRKGGETPLFDGLGSRRAGTDSTGTVTGAQTADAFGCPVTSDGAGGSAYGFGATSGYRTDGDGAMFIDAGLVKVGCRYYDPAVGRFTTRDTVLSQKAYVYCEANPVNYVDPSGHENVQAGNKLLGLGLVILVIGIGITALGGGEFGLPIGFFGAGVMAAGALLRWTNLIE